MKAELMNARTTVDLTYSVEDANKLYTVYVTLSDVEDISFDIVDEDGNEPEYSVWDSICDFVEEDIIKQSTQTSNN